ncbi:MAG: hypothetical protein HY719_12320 [Planctomycetes bacterium]|nr:hypothetical protein [Planctomycetota bacterium]
MGSMRLGATLLALVAAVIPARAAMATTAVRFSLEDLVRESAAIVEGRVLRTRADWDNFRRKIYTSVDVEVVRMFRGEAAPAVTLHTLGGQVGDKIQQVSGEAGFVPGEEVVVFLWRDAEGRLRPAGLAQGKFQLFTDAKSGERQARNSVQGLIFIDPATGKPEAKKQGPIAMRYADFAAEVTRLVAADDEAKKAPPAVPGEGREAGGEGREARDEGRTPAPAPAPSPGPAPPRSPDKSATPGA